MCPASPPGVFGRQSLSCSPLPPLGLITGHFGAKESTVTGKLKPLDLSDVQVTVWVAVQERTVIQRSQGVPKGERKQSSTVDASEEGGGPEHASHLNLLSTQRTLTDILCVTE